FWQHVRLAGLTTGSTDTTTATPAAVYLPVNAAGGNIGIQSGTSSLTATPMKDASNIAIRGTYIICSPNILGKFAKQLDIQLDDGNTQTGSMMAFDTSLGTPYTQGVQATLTTSINDADIVTVCMGV
ncbi:MAG: prepilin-type cleavage/methylation domain-containing protein, partial [Gallionella sp.]|nr:prepilin-type cleavage/methylation domain-containing protein [Gallionella sp.]